MLILLFPKFNFEKKVLAFFKGCAKLGLLSLQDLSNLLCTIHMPLYAAACIFLTLFYIAVYDQEWLILQTIYVLNKEILL